MPQTLLSAAFILRGTYARYYCFNAENGNNAVDKPRPRFSWKLKSDKDNVLQTAFQLTVKGGGLNFDTGKVQSSQSVLNDVLTENLKPAAEYTVHITVRDNHGDKAEGEIKFETALLDTGFENAQFIAPDFSYNPANAVVFKKINLTKKPQKARAYVSALGMYTLDINGKRAGDLFLRPTGRITTKRWNTRPTILPSF